MSDNDQKNRQGTLVFPSSLVAQAIRSGPYKNSVNALAEIIDNSYDAQASEIHVALIASTGSKKPHTIAVLDNGIGMDESTLQKSIQYGCHQAIEQTKRKRIGKFGVGLLSASFNQCTDLEIYSWKDGLGEEVNSTRITVDNCPEELPRVNPTAFPDFFENSFPYFDREASELDIHGTLVVWRSIDKLTWKKAETLSDHLQKEIGRIYREPLQQNILKIAISIVRESEGKFEAIDQSYLQPVDPLFLSNWKCDELETYQKNLKEVKKTPNEYGVTEDEIDLARKRGTLFKPFDIENENDDAYDEDGTIKTAVYIVKDDIGTEIGQYRITASYRWPKIVRAAAEAWNNDARNPGNAPYGKLAEKLRGVSIMRSGRELALDVNWLRADQTIDRWVALSLDFDPSLDAFFGVSNDKQYASHLSALAQVKTEDFDRDSSDYNKHVLQAAKHIHKILGKLRRMVGKDSIDRIEPRKDRQFDPAHEHTGVLSKITKDLEERGQDPRKKIVGIDDTELSKEKIKKALHDTTSEDEKAIVTRLPVILDDKLKVDIVTDPFASGSFMFSPVNNASGVMIIRLNEEHPLYRTLKDILVPPEEGESDIEMDSSQSIRRLQEQLDKSFTAIRTLIVAFSRAELEAASQSKEDFERVRLEWSYISKDLFKKED